MQGLTVGTWHHLFFGLLAQAVPGQGHLGAAVIGVDFDVIIVDRIGRVQPEHRVGAEPAALDQPLEHALPVGVDPYCLGADDIVLQDLGERPGQIPGLEERAPVNVAGQLGQVEIAKHPAPQKFGPLRRVAGPVDGCLVGARTRQRPHGRLLFIGVLFAHPLQIGLELGDVLTGFVAEQALRHVHTARGIGHVDHRTLVMGGNLDCGVHPAGGGAADQERDFAQPKMRIFLHFARHILHLLQAGRDQAREPDHVGTLHLGPGQNLMAGHHHPHVDHVEVIALQHHGDNVFTDVVHITLDRGDHDLAFGAHIAPGGLVLAFFFFDVGDQVGHRLLHHPSALDHLR